MIFIFCDYDELLSCNVHLLFLSLSCFKDFTVNNVNLETNRQFYLFVSWLDLSCVLLNKRLKKEYLRISFIGAVDIVALFVTMKESPITSTLPLTTLYLLLKKTLPQMGLWAWTARLRTRPLLCFAEFTK